MSWATSIGVISVFVFNYIFTIALWEFGCFIESAEVKNEVIREKC